MIDIPDRSHGSPYDRGRADSYYCRAPRPHKWMDGIGRVEITDLTLEERQEYHQGFDDNERADDHKDWRE